jgi:hypothetical protein
MLTHTTRVLRLLPAVAAIATLVGFPATASAMATYPSYAHREKTISGTIQNFNGAWWMYVRDRNGYVDTVSLHKGTVINPTGIQLQPGFHVRISGYSSGNVFVASVIDTPYRYAQPNYGYPGYAYPYYPYPYPYYRPFYPGGLYYGYPWR